MAEPQGHAVERLRSEGFSWPQVAAELGCSIADAIRAWYRWLGRL